MSLKFTCLNHWDVPCAPAGVSGALLLGMIHLTAFRCLAGRNHFLLMLDWLHQCCIDPQAGFLVQLYAVKAQVRTLSVCLSLSFQQILMLLVDFSQSSPTGKELQVSTRFVTADYK